MSSLDVKIRALRRRDGFAFPAEPCLAAVHADVHGHIVTIAPVASDAPTRVGGAFQYSEAFYKGGETEAANLDMSLCSIFVLSFEVCCAFFC